MKIDSKITFFQAFKDHKLCDPLLNPGLADVTADVDFKNLRINLEDEGKVMTFGPIEQSTFLTNMGAHARLQKLVENCEDEDEKETLKSGFDMLTNPLKMGSRFKFLSVFPLVLAEHLKKFPVAGFTENK